MYSHTKRKTLTAFLTFMLVIGSTLPVMLSASQENSPLHKGNSFDQTKSLLGDYWLLVIGIDRYRHWPTLENAVNDSAAVIDVLSKSYGFSPDRTITLFDEEATKENIFKTFVQLKDTLKEPDSLLIYYAGHGVLDAFDTGSWVPVEARVGAMVDYISTDHINRIMAKLPARHIFLVADACYSGSLFATRGLRQDDVQNDRYFRENARRVSRQALTSGGIEQVMDGGGRNGHSIFAFHFVQELARFNGAYLPASRIASSVRQLVARNSPQEPRWDHLRNTGDEDGEFFFLRKNTGTAENPPNVGDVVTRVKIRSIPSGADIYANGEKIGKTPTELHNASGEVAIQAILDGYRPAQERLRVRYDREQFVVLRLEHIEGSGELSVRSEPAGSAWYLDGAYMGITPDVASGIEAGVHTIKVITPERKLQERQVNVVKNGIEKILVDFSDAATLSASSKVAMTQSSDGVSDVYMGLSQVTSAERPDIDALQSLLVDYVDAYENKDINQMKSVANLTEAQQAFMATLFNTYEEIRLRVQSLSVTSHEAEATVRIERLVAKNGDVVLPGESWRQNRLTSVHADGNWGKIVWP